MKYLKHQAFTLNEIKRHLFSITISYFFIETNKSMLGAKQRPTARLWWTVLIFVLYADGGVHWRVDSFTGSILPETFTSILSSVATCDLAFGPWRCVKVWKSSNGFILTVVTTCWVRSQSRYRYIYLSIIYFLGFVWSSVLLGVVVKMRLVATTTNYAHAWILGPRGEEISIIHI